MVKRSRMKNPGEDDAIETVPPEVQAAHENNEYDDATVPQEGGFAPGVLEQINTTDEVNSASDDSGSNVPDEVAELEAAGVQVTSNTDADEQRKADRRSKNAFLNRVGQIGAAYGAGKTSMISLAESVTEAAAAKQIGPKDAEEIYTRFRKGADGKSTIDGEDGAINVHDDAIAEGGVASLPQQLSKVKSFIHLGNKMEGEAIDVIRRARNIHLDLLATTAGNKEARKGLKKGSTYTILVAVANAQGDKSRAGVPMTDGELREFMSIDVADRGPKDGADKLLDALVALTAAQRGGDERAPITSVHLDDAIESVRAALGEVDPAKLTEHDDKVQAAEDRKAEAAAKRAERAAANVAKNAGAAAQPAKAA